MLSFIAKSGAQLAIAAVVGVGGFGMAATHQSDVAADNSTEIHAPRPKLPSVSADAEASAVTKAAAEVKARSKPHASRWTAKGTVHAVVHSKPDEPTSPSEPSNPPSNPPSDDRSHERSHERSGVNLELDGSADLDGGGDLSIGPGGVQVGTQSHGSSGLKVSLGL
jgi:hypothetical protein